jgi:hypothetical protein
MYESSGKISIPDILSVPQMPRTIINNITQPHRQGRLQGEEWQGAGAQW